MVHISLWFMLIM